MHSPLFWIIFVENDEAMSDLEKIQLFENKKVRTAWDEEKQEWFFSIVDVCGVLTEQPDYDGARKYWKVLKGRLIAEGFELVSNCYQLHLKSPKDGTEYADIWFVYASTTQIREERKMSYSNPPMAVRLRLKGLDENSDGLYLLSDVEQRFSKAINTYDSIK